MLSHIYNNLKPFNHSTVHVYIYKCTLKLEKIFIIYFFAWFVFVLCHNMLTSYSLLRKIFLKTGTFSEECHTWQQNDCIHLWPRLLTQLPHEDLSIPPLLSGSYVIRVFCHASARLLLGVVCVNVTLVQYSTHYARQQSFTPFEEAS